MERAFDLITFDFDGVLLHNNYSEHFLEKCRTLNLRWPVERERELTRFKHHYFGSGLSRSDREEHGNAHFWYVANRRFLEALAAEGEVEEAIVSLSESRTEREFIYFYETGVHELMEALREQAYRIAMLTNRNDQVHEFAAEWGVIELFEFIATRDTVGKPKPAPDVYHHLNEMFGIPPSRSLHIGDNPFADVLGAHAAGWQALLIDPDNLFPDWDVPRIPTIHELMGWLASKAAG